VLGTRGQGNAAAPADTTPPESAVAAQPASSEKGSLPFTGSDAVLALLLAGCALVVAGVAVRQFLIHRA
jgi:hypothetical protein